MEPLTKKNHMDDRNLLEKITSLLERNIRGVQLGIYSIALGGLAIAFRSVRPFKKFTKPQEIPASFFEKHIELSGKVLRIDFTPQPFLVIDHTPILGSRFRSPGSGLLIKMEGIDISGNGISWLQAIIVGKDVNFTLLLMHYNCVNCIVSCKGKSIANTLVSLGFASVDTFNSCLENDTLYRKYYQRLLKDEASAESKGLGMWRDRVPTFSSRLLQYIFSKLPSIKLKT